MEKEQVIINNGITIRTGDTVYFQRVEAIWRRPYPRKRHHGQGDTRSVLLRGVILSIVGDEFKALLTDNNNFEKDGEAYVFHKGTLLSGIPEQGKLGIWEYQEEI